MGDQGEASEAGTRYDAIRGQMGGEMGISHPSEDRSSALPHVRWVGQQGLQRGIKEGGGWEGDHLPEAC